LSILENCSTSLLEPFFKKIISRSVSINFFYNVKNSDLLRLYMLFGNNNFHYHTVNSEYVSQFKSSFMRALVLINEPNIHCVRVNKKS